MVFHSNAFKKSQKIQHVYDLEDCQRIVKQVEDIAQGDGRAVKLGLMLFHFQLLSLCEIGR